MSATPVAAGRSRRGQLHRRSVRPRRVVATTRYRTSRRWDEWPVLLAFAAILLGAVRLALLVSPDAPGDHSPEVGFARDMITHHEQAVEMASIVYGRTQDPALRTLAYDILTTQQGQIGMMLGWLDLWGLSPTGDEPHMSWMGPPAEGRMPGMASREEVMRLGQLPPAEADVQFMRLMIQHHLGALPMAEAALELSDQPEVRRLAESILVGQQGEIALMQEMLRQRGAPPANEAASLSDHQDGEHGDEHGDGFLAGTGSAFRSTLSLLPLPLATFATAWLGSDTLRRRAGARGRRLPMPSPGWLALAVAGLLTSAALHAGLTPTHYEEATNYGIFFAAAATIEAVIAAAILAWPSPRTYLTGAAVALVLLAVYATFRLVPPPGAEGIEHVDLVGLTTKATEVVAALACGRLWLQAVRGRAG